MNEIEKSLQGIKNEALTMQFGVIALSVIIHAGKVKRVEKTITRKEQFDGKMEVK